MWHPVARAFYLAVWQNVDMQPSSRRESRCGFDPRHGHHNNPIKIKGTMKDLFNIIVAREEGYTRENFMAGALFVAGIVAVCIIAEIINAL